jgi:hypothetical protein
LDKKLIDPSGDILDPDRISEVEEILMGVLNPAMERAQGFNREVIGGKLKTTGARTALDVGFRGAVK